MSGQVRKTFLHSRRHSALERREEEPGETKDIQPLGRYSRAGRDMITFHFLKKGFSFLTYGEKWLMWQGGKGVKKKNQSFSQSIG